MLVDAGRAEGQRRIVLPADRGGRWRILGDRVAYRDADGWHRFTTLKGQGSFGRSGQPITLLTSDGSAAYRGRLTRIGTGSSAKVLDVVGMEAYVRGVVSREMPASWSPAAVQAQAVAARTYAAFERADHTTASYDLCDTTSCQVYGGVAAEYVATDAAVEATAHRILTSGGEPAFTQFGSSSGGYTSAGSQSYLRAVADPYDGWSGNPVHDWSTTITDRTLEAVRPAIGDLRTLRVDSRDGNGDWGGRVEQVTLIGSKGRASLSGDDLRSALGLRSTWFTFRVRK